VIALACGQLFLWTFSGPTNAVTVNVMPASVRTRAFGFQLICIHLFGTLAYVYLTHSPGDAVSPTIIGALSDAIGSLAIAISLVPITIFLGALVYAIGWKL
jgi:hypothetical protein